jgi:hypothetical protein
MALSPTTLFHCLILAQLLLCASCVWAVSQVAHWMADAPGPLLEGEEEMDEWMDLVEIQILSYIHQSVASMLRDGAERDVNRFRCRWFRNRHCHSRSSARQPSLVVLDPADFRASVHIQREVSMGEVSERVVYSPGLQ